ncbi:MAG: tRNA pseudouridine(38-40) synthase TruA [Acidobacteriota bacterium]|nr:tRNA pseudouridine(38-40) synthase TruA [Acidobacteriota bacterium]
MRNIELRLSYTGHCFYGWQIQPHCVTVQGVLKGMLARLLETDDFRIIGASRTDTGVHAHDQHVSLTTTNPIPCDKIVYALNRLAPRGVRVLSATERPPDFSVRHHARGKHYAYFINNFQGVSPFVEPFVWTDARPLDATAMDAATRHFPGTRCFKALQSQKDHRTNSTTTIHRARVTCTGDLVCFEVIGRHFLYHMVRNMVGSLVQVGRGEWTPDELGRRLEQGDRTLMGVTAPAAGLHLFKIYYGEPPFDYAPISTRFADFLALGRDYLL